MHAVDCNLLASHIHAYTHSLLSHTTARSCLQRRLSARERSRQPLIASCLSLHGCVRSARTCSSSVSPAILITSRIALSRQWRTIHRCCEGRQQGHTSYLLSGRCTCTTQGSATTTSTSSGWSPFDPLSSDEFFLIVAVKWGVYFFSS
jgi:hypothetical protein